MARVFISHSEKDLELKNFIAGLFASSDVTAYFAEWEKVIDKNPVDGIKIENDIKQSDALFILLSQNVENLKHTRDWVQWETGIAKGAGKEIWVFEPAGQLGSITVVTPSLHHLVIYATNDPWHTYLASAVRAFGKAKTVGVSTLLGIAIGALLGGERGAVTGGALGLGLSLAATDDLKKPAGLDFKCGNCQGSFKIHVPERLQKLRCPICNSINEMAWPKLS